MAYEIRYENTPADDERAIADALEYLGKESFDKAVEILRHPGMSLRDFEAGCALFLGLEGRPVFALMRKHRLADFRRECDFATDEAGFPLVQ